MFSYGWRTIGAFGSSRNRSSGLCGPCGSRIPELSAYCRLSQCSAVSAPSAGEWRKPAVPQLAGACVERCCAQQRFARSLYSLMQAMFHRRQRALRWDCWMDWRLKRFDVLTWVPLAFTSGCMALLDGDWRVVAALAPALQGNCQWKHCSHARLSLVQRCHTRRKLRQRDSDHRSSNPPWLVAPCTGKKRCHMVRRSHADVTSVASCW
mmetsp:Transcript_132017/g.240142  ORF Transcript_132017/g.240142 Transcript_132017/m.240142 type:complete len:208 (-) Transcript_132017:40-663(-)